jgi:hypothetical protein
MEEASRFIRIFPSWASLWVEGLLIYALRMVVSGESHRWIADWLWQGGQDLRGLASRREEAVALWEKTAVQAVMAIA